MTQKKPKIIARRLLTKLSAFFLLQRLFVLFCLSLVCLGETNAQITFSTGSGQVLGTSDGLLRVGDVAAVIDLGTPVGSTSQMGYSAINAIQGGLLAPLSGVVGFSRNPSGPFQSSIILEPPQAVDGVDVWIKALATHERLVLRKSVGTSFFDSAPLQIHPALNNSPGDAPPIHFSNMEVDDIVPIYATQTSSMSRRYIAYLASPGFYSVPSDNVIGFGTSTAGPFTNELTVSSATHGVPLFYLKAKKVQAYNFVREVLANGAAREFNNFEVSPKTPPPPPIGQAAIVKNWTHISVGEVRSVTIVISGGRDFFSGQIRLVDRVKNHSASALPNLGYSLTPNGDFSSSIDLPFSLNATGDGATPVVYVKGLHPNQNVNGASPGLNVSDVLHQNQLRVKGTYAYATMVTPAEFLTDGPLVNIPIGGVREIHLLVAGGSANKTDTFVVSEHNYQQSLIAGQAIVPYAVFSLNANGPFTPQLNVPIQTNNSGFGITQKIFFKPQRASTSYANPFQTTALVAKTQSAIQNAPSGAATIPSALPHPYSAVGPTVSFGKPTMQLGVGSTDTNFVNIEKGPPNQVTSVRIESRAKSGLIYGVGRDQVYFPEAIELSITLDAYGNGRTVDFTVRGAQTNSVVTANDNLIAAYTGLDNSVHSATADIDVVNVDLIYIQRFDPHNSPFPYDSPLDTNPNAGGGLRVFPEKQTPTDGSAYFDHVEVVAKLNRYLGGVKVDIRAFDVDDPSSDHIDVDSNGAFGNDNRGPISTPSDQNPSEENETGVTDYSGVFRKVFKLSHQPGDNWRFAAVAIGSGSASNGFYTEVGIEGTTLVQNLLEPMPNSDTSNTTTRGVSSDMLTVWRRLHIEMDSMGAVTGNVEHRTITGVEQVAGRTIIRIDGPALEPKRFVDGFLIVRNPNNPFIENSESYTIVANGNRDLVFATPPGGGAFGNAYDLGIGSEARFFDDDDANMNGLPDEFDDVNMPDVGWMQDSDNPNHNKLAAAYIRPTYDLGFDDDLPFILNTPQADTTAAFPRHDELCALSSNRFEHYQSVFDKNFWTVYLLGAYQIPVHVDLDPNAEGGENSSVYSGIANAYCGAIVFNEMIPDVLDHIDYPLGVLPAAMELSIDSRSDPLHEIGHLLRATHEDGGFMTNDLDSILPEFSAKSLDSMRSLEVPWMGLPNTPIEID